MIASSILDSLVLCSLKGQRCQDGSLLLNAQASLSRSPNSNLTRKINKIVQILFAAMSQHTWLCQFHEDVHRIPLWIVKVLNAAGTGPLPPVPTLTDTPTSVSSFVCISLTNLTPCSHLAVAFHVTSSKISHCFSNTGLICPHWCSIQTAAALPLSPHWLHTCVTTSITVSMCCAVSTVCTLSSLVFLCAHMILCKNGAGVPGMCLSATLSQDAP